MAKQFSSDSSISIDSLEQDFQHKVKVKKCDKANKRYNENVDTILVPFYEKDVLIKVPKDIKQNKADKNKLDKLNKKEKKCADQITNFLVNKEKAKGKRTSYLEIFRKQLAPHESDKKVDNEIRSLTPEVGDSERDTFIEEINNDPSNEFFETECYNEIYYEQLLSKDFEQYLDYDIDVDINISGDIANKTIGHEEVCDSDLKSISEVSHCSRRIRRVTVPPIQNVNLGGLGPDIEKIKPSLERARSLQRYSEKVRMENRLRIYKKGIKDEINSHNERENSGKLRKSRRDIENKTNRTKHDERQNIASYLVNKSGQDLSSNKISKIYFSKSKSTNPAKTKEIRDQCMKSTNRKYHPIDERNTKNINKFRISKENKIYDEDFKPRMSGKSKAINTEIQQIQTEAPIHISFLVSVGGIRPSTALKTLEEKHRIYQEKVKAFTMNYNM